MTEAQIEAAARKYCELRGYNPDEHIHHDANGNWQEWVTPRWKNCIELVKQNYYMTCAVNEAIRTHPTLPAGWLHGS